MDAGILRQCTIGYWQTLKQISRPPMFDLKDVQQSIIRILQTERLIAATVLLILVCLVAIPATAMATGNGSATHQPSTIEQPAEQSTSCGASAYRVKHGDTLGAIARRFGTTSRAIRQCNGLSSSVVYAGQILSIPGVVNNSVSTPGARVTRSYSTPPPSGSSGGADTYNPYYRERRPTPVPRR